MNSILHPKTLIGCSLTAIGFVFFSPTDAIAQSVLLNDTFPGSSLNTSLWTPTTPFADSSVTVSGGDLNLSDRGFVTSIGSFTGTLEIDTSVELTGAGSAFSFVWKTDGIHTSSNPTAESVGLEFDLFDESQLISFGEEAGNSPVASVDAPFALPLDTFFDVKIVDTGTIASVYLDGATTPNLQFDYDPSFLAGDGQLELYSREGDRSAILDSIKVSSVPDFSETLGLLAFSFAGLAILRRRLIC
jgi:hypothetical protein